MRASRYSEDDLRPDRVLDGATTQRYQIDIQQLAFLTPIGPNFVLTADVIRESMTGASPLGGVKVAEDDVRVVMSGASISEERQDVTLGGAWYGESNVYKVSVGQSIENDYDARYASIGTDFNFNQDSSTIGFTLSASNDELTPTDAEQANRIPFAEKSSRSAHIGYTQILTRNLIAQTGLGATRLEGYLSDPYKAGSIISPQDRRPDERLQYVWTFAFRYFMEPVSTALQFDYRYFTDDWGIDSHTVKAGLERQFGVSLQLGLGLRWYMQSEAGFYEPYAVPQVTPQPEFFSMDYRLSPYGAVSANLSGKWEFISGWSAVFVVERYRSSGDYSLADVTLENPGNVDFTRASLGIEYRF